MPILIIIDNNGKQSPVLKHLFSTNNVVSSKQTDPNQCSMVPSFYCKHNRSLS